MPDIEALTQALGQPRLRYGAGHTDPRPSVWSTANCNCLGWQCHITHRLQLYTVSVFAPLCSTASLTCQGRARRCRRASGTGAPEQGGRTECTRCKIKNIYCNQNSYAWDLSPLQRACSQATGFRFAPSCRIYFELSHNSR